MTARYMLDTNICIYLMKNQPAAVVRRFEQCSVGDVIISAITLAELEYGALASASKIKHKRYLNDLMKLIPVEPFGAKAALAYGPIRQATSERKRDQLDKLIAAHARSLDVVLVTNNIKDFRAYPDVRLENWLEDTD
jgi:tRNA(fMet)-specific endonuclease VapC